MISKTILIVCKNDLLGRSLGKYFHGLGYRVETVRVLSQMIRKVVDRNIHVVLVDDEVEGVKAWESGALLKRTNRGVQVIVISSEESLGVARQLRGAGTFYQAMKPVDLSELKSAVESGF